MNGDRIVALRQERNRRSPDGNPAAKRLAAQAVEGFEAGLDAHHDPPPPEGEKELVGFQTRMRESAQSSKARRVDPKKRGLVVAPKIVVGAGALGFRKALEAAFPTTRRPQSLKIIEGATFRDRIAIAREAKTAA